MIALNVLQRSLSLLSSNSLLFLVSGLISFLLTFSLIPIVITVAHKYRILDEPDGKIKTHREAIPYLGGLAVFAGFVSSVVLIASIDARVSFLLLGCTLLMLIGLLDDLLMLSPSIKFMGQALVVFGFVRAGLYLKEEFFQGLWAIPLSAFWLLVIMNAINLIDVMDGLSSSVALSVAGGYCIIALLNGNVAMAQILILFMGAMFAFFYYNKPPAKIYLGDTGSLFIGGFLGVVPLLLTWSDFVPWGFILAPLPLIVPQLELAELMLIRTIKGIPFYKGSKDHFCHYLQSNGWSKIQINAYASSVTLVTSLLVVLAYLGFLTLTKLCIIGFACLGLWALILLPRKK